MTKRRFPRAHGPFYGYYQSPQTPVLVYDLNLGGGFVNFGSDEPTSAAHFMLSVALPDEGMITLNAETIYRQETGVAVRFVDVDLDTSKRLARTVSAMIPHPPAH